MEKHAMAKTGFGELQETGSGNQREDITLKMQDIYAMLRKAVPRHVLPRRGEEVEDLVQDGAAQAAAMLAAASAAGKAVSTRSVMYYTIQRLKAGYRSFYKGDMDCLAARSAAVFAEDLEEDDGETVPRVDTIPDRQADLPFRIDLGDFAESLSPEERRIAELSALELTDLEIEAETGIRNHTISRLRARWRAAWRAGE